MIQIDMQMPKNCADCCFATADLVNGIITLFCMTPAGRKMYAPDLISRKDRPEWCPIKELIPCKDCKHHGKKYTHANGYEYVVCWRDGYGIHKLANGFCADGERKESR